MAKESIFFVTGNVGKLREVTSFLDPPAQGMGSNAEKPFPYRLESVKVDLDELQSDTAEHISQVKALEAFRVVNHLRADAVTRCTVGESGAEQFQLTFTVGNEDLSHSPFKAVLVDDTSLSFAALGDMPGPYIKFFLQTLGPANLVHMVAGFAPPPEDNQEPFAAELGHRRATATSIFTLARASVSGSTDHATTFVVKTEQFIGNSPGCLVAAPRGASGFGWDSAFAPLVNPSNYEANSAALAAYAKDPQSRRFPRPDVVGGFVVDERAFTRTYAELSADEKNLVSHRAVALRKLKEALTE